MQRATAFRRALQFVRLDDLPTNVTEALQLGGDLERAAKLDKLPPVGGAANADDSIPIDVLLAARGRGGGRG